MKTLIIAEIGENHLGDLKLAKKMIIDAAKAGADVVKFQSYKGEDFKNDDPEKEWFEKVALSDEAHSELKKIAEENNVEFLSAPFSLERAGFLVEKLGLTKIKVASGMMLNFKLLDYLNSANIDSVYLSTGMATIAEIKEALSHLNKVKQIYLLHCVTQYPCKDKDANVSAMLHLKKEFNLPVGYSDHTIGIDACLIAASLDAEVIEKHFTFDKNAKGDDHVLSADFKDLKEMIEKIRKIEKMLGSGVKKPCESEENIKDFVRNRFPK